MNGQLDKCSIEKVAKMCRIVAVETSTLQPEHLLRQLWSCRISTNRRTNDAKNLRPFSTTPKWKAVEGFFQSLAFAGTMGAAVLVTFIVLWVSSVPWVAWCLVRLVHPAVSVFSAASFPNCCSSGCKRRQQVQILRFFQSSHFGGAQSFRRGIGRASQAWPGSA